MVCHKRIDSDNEKEGGHNGEFEHILNFPNGAMKLAICVLIYWQLANIMLFVSNSILQQKKKKTSNLQLSLSYTR